MVKSAFTRLSTTVLHLRNFLPRIPSPSSFTAAFSSALPPSPRPSHSRVAFIVSSLGSLIFFFFPGPRDLQAIQIARHEEIQRFRYLRNFGSREDPGIPKSRTAKVAKVFFFLTPTNSRVSVRLSGAGPMYSRRFSDSVGVRESNKGRRVPKMSSELNSERLAHQQFRSLVDYVHE